MKDARRPTADGMRKLFNEKNLHAAFKAGMAFKGMFSMAEIAAGIFAYFATRQFVVNFTRFMTRAELSEDPRDFIANHLLHAAQGMSPSGRHFAALYLLSHGALKLWLIAGLWRGKPAYYPVAIAVFGLFIVYQLYRYGLTHSPLLLFITALDFAVIGLTWVEYRHLHGHLRGISGKR